MPDTDLMQHYVIAWPTAILTYAYSVATAGTASHIDDGSGGYTGGMVGFWYSDINGYHCRQSDLYINKSTGNLTFAKPRGSVYGSLFFIGY